MKTTLILITLTLFSCKKIDNSIKLVNEFNHRFMTGKYNNYCKVKTLKTKNIHVYEV